MYEVRFFLPFIVLYTIVAALGVFIPGHSHGDDSIASAKRGYQLLTTRAYLTPDFDQDTFENVWTVWPEPLRSKAANATPEQRRTMAFSRYGLTPRPDNPALPLQYVVSENGGWSMNCFACHGGKVLGRTIPGLPNSHYAMQTLTEETRSYNLRNEKPLSRLDVGSYYLPLGGSNGTTNAVMFGVALLAHRDAELNVHPDLSAKRMVHHDMDAPPWWHFQKKKMLYIDGFAPKDHRALMQFTLEQANGPETFREREADFKHVYEYLNSLQPPKYPFPINEELANRGRVIFTQNCAECHGTYGDDSNYPNKLVPIEDIDTDRVRLDALSVENREHYGKTWFTDFGRKETVADPGGYVAPPLDGVWASAPYLHNGSVPTLWHLLHPAERPVVWRRTEDGFDKQNIGLEVAMYEKTPREIRDFTQLREYFDTRKPGKSAGGHLYPNALTEDERNAVLEYLKTL